MVRTMSLLRLNLFTVIAALVAALAVLFVSTTSLAFEAPVDHGQAAMSMNDDRDPCEQKTVSVSCPKACLIFCQSLVPRGGDTALVRLYGSVLYPSVDARHANFTVEADDPPPRA